MSFTTSHHHHQQQQQQKQPFKQTFNQQSILVDQPHQVSSYMSNAKLLKPLFLAEQTQPTSNQTINHTHHIRSRAPSLNLPIQPLNLNSFSSSPCSTRSRRSTSNSKLSRSSSVSLLRSFTHSLPLPRSMSLAHSTKLPSQSIYQHHQILNNIENSKPCRSSIPYSKSNSSFIPSTHHHHHHHHSQSNHHNTSPPFPPSPSDTQHSDIDSQLDSMLASMIDCAKSFGIQDELNGIVDI